LARTSTFTVLALLGAPRPPGVATFSSLILRRLSVICLGDES
jgi:hypothetical protein